MNRYIFETVKKPPLWKRPRWTFMARKKKCLKQFSITKSSIYAHDSSKRVKIKIKLLIILLTIT